MSRSEGRELLQKFAIKGDDDTLEQIVTDWDGHALTLSQIGTFLSNWYDGDAKYINDLLSHIDSGNQRLERVVPQQYAHWKPIKEEAFDEVFQARFTTEESETPPLNAPLLEMDNATFEEMIDQLVSYRIVRHDLDAGHYSLHPLIRQYYQDILHEQDVIQVQELHQHIKEYYIETVKVITRNPKVEELLPLFEAVHHACCAGKYDQADEIILK